MQIKKIIAIVFATKVFYLIKIRRVFKFINVYFSVALVIFETFFYITHAPIHLGNNIVKYHRRQIRPNIFFVKINCLFGNFYTFQIFSLTKTETSTKHFAIFCRRKIFFKIIDDCLRFFQYLEINIICGDIFDWLRLVRFQRKKFICHLQNFFPVMKNISATNQFSIKPRNFAAFFFGR